jgi:hypothetical protein
MTGTADFRVSRRCFLGAVASLCLPALAPSSAADFAHTPEALDVGELLRELVAGLGAEDPRRAAEQTLRRALADPAAALLSFGEPNQSGYEPIYRSAALTVVNAGWRPGLSLPPHDHGMWSVTGVYTGVEANTLWVEAGDGLTASGKRRLEAGQVLSLGAADIHSVSNPGRHFTGAVQIYGGDFLASSFHRWDADGGRRELTHAEAERLRFERDNAARPAPYR